MKRRQKEKIVKRKIKEFIDTVNKYFTVVNVRSSAYHDFGSCLFSIKEEPRLVIGIQNIKTKESKGGHPLTFFVLPKSSYKKIASYAHEYNTSHDIKGLLYILTAAVNDFLGRMKDGDDTKEEFQKEYDEYIEERENNILCGMNSQELYECRTSLKNIINNLDYEKIPILVIHERRKSHRIEFGPIALVRFYPDWDKCTDEYLDWFEKALDSLNITNLQWRTLDVSKISKRARKQDWKVYSNGVEMNLHKFNKL